MKKELQDELLKKYPKIFAQHKLPCTQTAMCWLFECGDGWYWLIDQLCKSIQSYIDHNTKDYQLEAVQVKEKYGELRFYTNGESDAIHGMIWLAERMSNYICEKCGSVEGVSQTKGWIISLCQTCMKKYKNKNDSQNLPA